MDRFELITVTFSFIVGLGIAQMLSACSLALRNRSNQALNQFLLVAGESGTYRARFFPGE